MGVHFVLPSPTVIHKGELKQGPDIGVFAGERDENRNVDGGILDVLAVGVKVDSPIVATDGEGIAGDVLARTHALAQRVTPDGEVMGKKTYVVFVGRCPGVYDNWEDAKAQVHRFSDNLYKSFPSNVEAISAFNTFNQRQQNSSASFDGASNAASTSSSQNSTAAGNNSSPLEPVEILSEQLDLPEAHGDGIERQPAEDGEAIFVPTMSSINLDVGLTTLSGCRTLAIDFIEFCNDKSILTNFIFWTESEGDTVDVRHGTSSDVNVGELINYGEQHAFLRRILCRHRNVIRYLVFFNYEVGEVHLIAFDKCGM
nr:ribonuclease HI [Ipomoea batatas]